MARMSEKDFTVRFPRARIPSPIQTAGNHSAIGENPHLVTKAIAEALAVIFLGLERGPLKFIILVKKKAMGDFQPPSRNCLLLDAIIQGKGSFQGLQEPPVASLSFSRGTFEGQVPEAKRNHHVRLSEGFLHKGENGVEILNGIQVFFLALQTVEGDVHLP